MTEPIQHADYVAEDGTLILVRTHPKSQWADWAPTFEQVVEIMADRRKESRGTEAPFEVMEVKVTRRAYIGTEVTVAQIDGAGDA
jgi:hypothetical protein